MSCPHAKIQASLDRWHEAHWQLHQIEQHYHDPEPFRYSFNAFIRVIKEVQQILKMDLQNERDYHSFIKPLVDTLRQDPLLSTLGKKRDFVVHHGMLDIRSKGTAGSTRGGPKIKMGVEFDVSPQESSDDAFRRFARTCKGHPDFCGLLGLQDDDLFPCIQRVWLLQEFDDRDLLELAIAAWRETGTVISKLVEHFGGGALDLMLACAPAPEDVRMRKYSRKQFADAMSALPSSPS